MGCIFIILRSVFSLILGVVVFFGFLAFVLNDNLTDQLFEADFYTGIIIGENTYERIYDEVLLDEELEDTTRDLLGDIQVVSQQEIVELLKKIVPPEYLQSRKDRKKVEVLFAHLKRVMNFDRLRLRGLTGAHDEFLLAATVQNLKKLAQQRFKPPDQRIGAPVLC